MNRFFYISPLVLQTLIWPIVRPLFWFFLHLEVKGVENLSAVKGANGLIFAANHSSELDPILVPASLPFVSPRMPMFYTSREQSFYKKSGWRQMFYGGFFFKIWGSHNLNSGKHDYEKSLQTHIKILQDGKSLCMFPDGRRTSEDEIGSIAHGGVGYLLWKTGAPIVPVRIHDAYLIPLSRFFTRRRRVSVTFGLPIFREAVFSGATDSKVEDFKKVAQYVMQKVASLPTAKTASAVDKKSAPVILKTD